MKFIRMVLINCKKYFKDYKNITIMFILPIVCVAMANFLTGDIKKGLNIKVAVVNLDKGNLGGKLIEDLEVNSVYYNKEKALEELKNYSIIALYEIPESFTEEINKNVKPKINAYKLEEGNSTQIFEAQIEQKLNELLKVNLLKSNNIIEDEKDIDRNIIKLQYNLKQGLMTSEGFTPIILIMFFLVSFSSNITVDLLKLRKEKILERFLSTNNKGYEIMGSIYLSMLLVQVVMYTASFLVMKIFFKFEFENFGILILNISLMSMVSISLGVMISRMFKDQGVATIVITLISMIMFFLYVGGMAGENSSKVPRVIITLSKFTPFYWAMDSIEKSMLFPNVLVLILIALVFFSAGSIRYSSFAKKL